MRGHGGSNAVAGDTHDGGNKAMRGEWEVGGWGEEEGARRGGGEEVKTK